MRIIVKAMAVGALALGMSGGFVSFDSVNVVETATASTVNSGNTKQNSKKKKKHD
ncbi:hypothetical protein OIT44_05390 [Weissella ceti]|uniref:Uncharacterized protein n=1 Tax=Weissella ceti TaxID=759620 RepID=A0ABT3E6E5_9LACO|nr:hypothetical protein [Weissella ceti]MCW0953503.1 hypothetical protein [Weissella ceti]